MQFKTFIYQSSKIYYRIVGTGRPVILLHGFGEDGEIWNDQVDFLSTGCFAKDYYRLLIPDLPGSGRSELIADMSIEGMAEVIKEIINLELQNSSPSEGDWVGILGHSMGGYIALALAEKHPGLLNAFGLVHSSAFADSEEKKSARLKSIEFMKRNGAYAFLKTSIPGLFSQQWAVGNGQRIDALIERGKNFSAEVLVQYYEAMLVRPDRTAVLKNFDGPILFIIGEHDIAAPFQQSLQQCYLPMRSHIHILRNSAHMGMLEEVNKTNQALKSFLNL